MRLYPNKPFATYYANSINPYIPELWANESLLILEEQMVMGNLVHRDFEPVLANYGQTVHTRKPSQFTARRKTNADSVIVQDVSAVDVPVVLDQWIHTAFTIKDGERTFAFKDLVNIYLWPAMIANARLLDQALCARAIGFLGNSVGGVGTMTNSNARDYVVNAREQLNQTKAYFDGRNLVLANNSEAQMLRTDIFTKALEVGMPDGKAIRDAYLGTKYQFDTFMDLNIPSLPVGVATKGTGTTTTAAAAAGATALAVTAAMGVGTYVTVAGDNSVLRSTTNTTTMTLQRPTIAAVASGAAVTKYASGAVHMASDPTGITTTYPAGYTKEIYVNGTGIPHVGQIFATVDTGGGGLIRTEEYMIVQVTSIGGGVYSVLLDRNLVNAINDNDVVNYGPDGDINFAFHRNALALVNRPLAAPIPGTGARAAVATHNGMSMRVVITYDGHAQGHLVTLDGLFGTAILDTNLGACLLG